jgi:AraC-like DNA-binding protein
MNEGLLMSLSVDGDRAYTSFSWTLPHPPAANDIVVASALAFSKRVCLTYEAPLEVRMQHAAPAYAASYEKLLGVPVRFAATSNLIVMKKSRLAAPLRRSSPSLAAAFASRVQSLEHERTQGPDLVAQVHHAVIAQLATGSIRMANTARRLGMSVATLRRKLEDHGTSFASIVEGLQREAALRYLSTPEPTVSEVALLLGFADVRSFARAFRRWTGVAPTEFRKKAEGTLRTEQ